MDIDNSLPPCDINAEAAVLGSILIDPDVYYEVAEALTPAMFYRPGHRWLFQAIHDLNERSEATDLLTIGAELTRAGKLEEAGGMEYLIYLLNVPVTSVNAEYYAGIVAEKAARRRLILAAGSVARLAYNEATPIDDVMAGAEAAVIEANAAAQRGTVIAPRRFMSDYVDGFLSDIAAGPGTNRVITTGLADLDRMLGGLERSHQYLIAGRTSMGKSSLALGVGLHAAARQNKSVLIFSLEMSQEQIVNRLVSMMTRIPLERLKPQRRHELSEAERTAVLDAGGRLADMGVYIDTTAGLRPADIRARASRIAAAHGLDMVVVDHMHIMAANKATGKQVQDLGSIAIDLANIYKDLNVVGLTLAQLNRGVDARALKRPILSDLRESGQIEEAAYVAMFVHREGYYDDTADRHQAEVIVAKNRDGATGSVYAYWNEKLASFGNAAQVNL